MVNPLHINALGVNVRPGHVPEFLFSFIVATREEWFLDVEYSLCCFQPVSLLARWTAGNWSFQPKL